MNTHGAAIGWTLVRVVFGLTLALGHGLPKVTGGISRFAEGVAALGFPFPTFFAWCAALAELAGRPLQETCDALLERLVRRTHTDDVALVAASLERRDSADSTVVDFLTAAPGVTVIDSTSKSALKKSAAH